MGVCSLLTPSFSVRRGRRSLPKFPSNSGAESRKSSIPTGRSALLPSRRDPLVPPRGGMRLQRLRVRVPVDVPGAVGDLHRRARCPRCGDLRHGRMEPCAVMCRDQMRNRAEGRNGRRKALVVGIPREQRGPSAGQGDVEGESRVVRVRRTGAGRERAAWKGRAWAGRPDKQIAFPCEDQRDRRCTLSDLLMGRDPLALKQMPQREGGVEMIPIPVR